MYRKLRKRKAREGQQVTRRQFLKETGLLVGGAAISSIAITSGCDSSSSSGTKTVNTTPTTNPTTTTSNTSINTTTTTTTTLPPAEGFVYKTPLEQPPVMPIPGCTTFTATDRKYIIEHMWVKMVAEGIVAIGVTEKMTELMDVIYSLSLPPESEIVQKDTSFIYADAAKMAVEFVAPVSGTVLQVNNGVFLDLTVIKNDPWVGGWFLTIKLSNPEEWDDLLLPQEYTDLNAKVL